MEFKIYSFNNALELLTVSKSKKEIWDEISNSIKSITDRELMDYFNIYSKSTKSLSKVIRMILDNKLLINYWTKNQNMFSNDDYVNSKRFSFNYFKSSINLEFAFNHESATAWILLKGSLLNNNQLTKVVNVDISIIITVDNRMKSLGGFDGSIGTFEKYIQYLGSMEYLIDKPILLIGLEPASEFIIKHRQLVNRKIGIIREMS